jgi:nitrogen regulatory protein PII
MNRVVGLKDEILKTGWRLSVLSGRRRTDQCFVSTIDEAINIRIGDRGASAI